MEEHTFGLKKKTQRDYWGNMIAVKKIKIGTLGLPSPFHIMEHAENISLATGVTRAAWRWT